MRIIDCIQGSQQWLLARRGIPTASQFGRILTPKTQKLAAAADTLIAELIGETFDLSFGQGDEYISFAMKKGLAQEPQARAWYAMERGVDVQQIGFCTTDDGRFGCSPDGLVNGDGVLEMKNPSAAVHVQYLLDGSLPSDYRAQVHGELIVTGRAYCDFLSYCPGLPHLLIRVEPDAYTQALRDALEVFWAKYQAALKKIKGM